MRLSSLILMLALLVGLAPAHAADAPPGCDSCAIKVDSLAEPTRLVGKWLFTREDSPANAAISVDTSDTAKWRLVKAPGPWKHAYDDHKNFTVGWYRGAFDFAPNLVGREAVVMVNAHMGHTKVWIDGQEVSLVEASASLTDEETAQLVFLPGLSTAEVVTEVSGRGVGMDAVKGFLEREGGRVGVRFLGARTASGHRPFEFVIVLPATFAVAS